MKPLHYKKHTLAKRGLSLLCVLALCLGLLPVTALAAGEIELYVGETQITASGYWKTNDDGTLTTEGAGNDNYNVHYDGNGTLTLNNANIQGGNDSQNPQPKDYGIYAASTSGQSVDLTIKLIGSNTVSGYGGICVEAQNGGNATLVIQSDGNDSKGSLEAIGSGRNGITMSSNSGNVFLTINKASVEASTEKAGYYGVSVKSNAGSPTISLTVNGGSLTAQGDSRLSGIRYFFQTNASNPSISLTVQNNALVKATPSIVTSNNLSKPDTTAGSESGGIVFDGKNGTVYGDVTLQEDLEIGTDETLTIPEGSTLNTNGNLTNNGTIVNKGTLNGDLTGGTGTVVNAPAITDQPKSQTVTEGQSASFTVTATGESLSYQWQQSADNGLSWTDIDGATSATHTIAATSTDMSGTQYRCVVSNSAGSITSDAATLTVNAATVPVTDVSLDKGTISLFTGESETLTAVVVPVTATDKSVTWESSDTAVATVQDGTVTAVGAGEATITVKTADGGKTATCTVTVTDKTYTISADTTALDFGSAYTGYAQPAAQTVTVKNTGNQTVTLNQPSSTDNFVVDTLSTTNLAAGETATFTIQPKDKLPRGSYSEQIVVSNTNDEKVIITATFTVKEPPYTGKYSYELTTSVGDHGSLTVDRYATEGDEVTITVTPDEAYKLDDLSVTAGGKEVALTAGGDGTFSFTMPSADVKISATFAEDPDWTEPEEPATDVSDIFLDIAANAWYKDAVQYAYAGGLMTGVSANEFAPEATTTRAMIVSMLARLEGVESAESAGFTDVAADDWYATAVNWAAASGITSGTGDGTFQPNTAITREQMAAILMNYAQYKGQDVSARATLDTYNDATAISSWANDVMSWAVAEGLLTGVTNDQLQPQGNATRAQVAAILERFLAE